MPEKTELQNINKGIQNVTEELKKGNAAQKKDSQEQEKRISTWGSIKTGFDAFNISLKHEEDNKITWGKIGGQLKESIGVWYKQTMEMDNLLGKTFRVGAAIWENVDKYIISNFKTAFSNISSGIKEVLGPVAELFDSVKNAIMGVFGFFKGMYTSIFGKVKPEDKVRNRLLQGIVNYFKDEKKAEAREMGGKKKMPKPLAMLLFGLGVVIGAVVGAIMAPFRLLLGVLKKVKPIALAITKYFGTASKFGKVIAKAGKYLGPLAKGLKLGFKVLGWPVTILLGVIDGIRGFLKSREEGGTIVESLLAGIKAAFMGLFEMPVKIIGWVADKILKLFGVEVKGGIGQKIMDAISSIFDWIFKIPEFITKAWNWVKSGKKGSSTEEANKMFSDPLSTDYQKQQQSKLKQTEEEIRLKRRQAYEKNLEEQKIKDKADKDKADKADKTRRATLEENKLASASLNQINQTTINSQTTVEQIPDELDGSIANLTLIWDI